MATVLENTAHTTTHVAGEGGIKALFTTSSGTFSVTPGGVWLTAIVSAVLAQMEYRARKNELRELYRDEVAAQLGKERDKVTIEDFELLAKKNHTLSEEMDKARKDRNLGIGVIGASTLAAVGTAIGVMTLINPVGMAAGFSLTTWLATTAVAMMAYSIIKYPVQKLSKKILGLEGKTTQDHIESIFKDHMAGKVITHERVFEVFVNANPPLEQHIKQEYGKSFDKLKPVDRLQLANDLGQQLGVGELTDAINQGKIRSTELAFTVEGKFSGVKPTLGDQPKHSFKEKVTDTVHHAAEKLHNVADKLTGHHPADEKPVDFFAKRERERRAAPQVTQR